MKIDDDGYIVDDQGNRLRCDCPEEVLDERGEVDWDASREAENAAAEEWVNSLHAALSLPASTEIYVAAPEGRAYFVARVGEPVEI